MLKQCFTVYLSLLKQCFTMYLQLLKQCFTMNLKPLKEYFTMYICVETVFYNVYISNWWSNVLQCISVLKQCFTMCLSLLKQCFTIYLKIPIWAWSQLGRCHKLSPCASLWQEHNFLSKYWWCISQENINDFVKFVSERLSL